MNIVIEKKSEQLLDKLNNAINKGINIFVFVSADWCGHCKDTIPIWSQLENNNYGDDVMIARVDSELHNKIDGFGEPATGFPDLRYINKSQGIVEKYNNGRTIEEFDDWVKSKSGKKNPPKKQNQMKKQNPQKKQKKQNNKHVKGTQYGGTRRTKRTKRTKRR